MLVKHIQVHRGLTALHASGEVDIMDELRREAGTISNDIDTITLIAPQITEDGDWQGITQHWARLSARDIRLEKYDYYEQHCKLIASCLMLMRSVAINHKVTQNTRPDEKIFWFELLSLGEKLGQLRALGTMHLHHSSNAKTRNQRLDKIKACLNTIESVFFERNLQERIGQFNCEEINTFLAIVEHYIVEKKAWITSDRYFSRATETMEIIYTIFDEEMQSLLKQI